MTALPESDRPIRKHTVEKLAALPFHDGTHHEVDERHAHQSGQCTGQSPLLCGCDDGGNEGKRTAEEDRHSSFGDKMEDERAQTGREEGGGGVDADEQGHEHRGAESHEKELHPHDGFLR